MLEKFSNIGQCILNRRPIALNAKLFVGFLVHTLCALRNWENVFFKNERQRRLIADTMFCLKGFWRSFLLLNPKKRTT